MKKKAAVIKKNVFIVHGHDKNAVKDMKKMIRRLKMQPVVLNEKPGRGRTLIEKFEEETKDINYAVVLLTPDDKGCAKRKKKLQKRVRQNVIFEMGYFFGKLGRDKVLNLLRGDVEKPSDIEGISYLPFKSTVMERKKELRRELKGVEPFKDYKPTIITKKVKVKPSASSKEKLGVKAFNKGVDFYEAGKIDEAAAKWRETVRLKPDYAMGHYALGVALGAKGETEEAIKEYREAIRLEPDEASTHYALGVALGKKGETDEAIKEFREAIRLEPDAAIAHYALGLELGLKGETGEALKEFRETIQLKPDYGSALVHLAMRLDAIGERKEAREYWERALKVEKDPKEVKKIKKRLAEPR
jgi:tetratricopeptide (TPR) repeat protein